MVVDGRASVPVRASRLRHRGLVPGRALTPAIRALAMPLCGCLPHPAQPGP